MIKKYLPLFIALFSAIFTACGDSDPETDFPDALYVDLSQMDFEKEGGYKFLSINSVNIAWEVTSDADWILISPSKGYVSTPVRIAVKANESATVRTDTVWVKSTYASHPSEYAVKIVQKGN